MSTDRSDQAAAIAGGEGPLARLLETRGGTAAPEASFVIEHREALIYMLCQAAELEHGIMCQYLFAAFSLKESGDEGLTPDELAAVTRWQKQILSVAAGEMLHLALVHNLLSASAPPRTCPGRICPPRPGTIPPGCSWPCCRSVTRRCGISCSWSARRAWICRTPRAWPPCRPPCRA
jgi:hypothetical protein